MKSAVIAVLVGAASAYPDMKNGASNIKARQDPNPWIPRQAGGVRAPCPGMNTLANHGYISRDGTGISAQNLIDGFQAAFNLDPSVTTTGANNAINLCSSLQGAPCQTFDLWMMDTTHNIEHDGSLTRSDRNETWNVNGNNYDFNTTRWSQTLAAWGGASHIDLSLANSARLARNAIQRQDDTPGWFVENDGGALNEHAFYLSTMNDQTQSPGQDASNPQARVDWIVHWFQQEELPTALGWVRPTQVISEDYVGALSASVGSAPTTAPPAGVITTEPSAIATADKRDIGLLTALLAEPTGVAAVSNAAASASAAAGPKPTAVNAYNTELTPEEWTAQRNSFNEYIDKFENTLNSLLSPPQ